MHLSRYMKRLARQMIEEDPDALKVRNDNPSEEFAFDITPPIEIGTATESTSFEAVDDFGNPVSIVPLDLTGVEVFLSFARTSLRLDFSSSVPVGTFIIQVCHLIRTLVCQPDNPFQASISADKIQRLQIYRVFWDAGLAAWTLHWVDEPEPPLPNCLWRDGLTRLKDSIQGCFDGSLTLGDALCTCVIVLDCNYPQMAKEDWGGLTQLVYDSSEEDDYLNSIERERHAQDVFRAALPLIEDRLAKLPVDESEDQSANSRQISSANNS